MELENVESDLQSLRRLYGLLESSAVTEPRTETSLLDQNSQMLLKRLLDAATEELFARQSKILAAAQLSLSEAVASRAEQGKGLHEFKPLFTRNVSNSWSSSRYLNKDWSYSVAKPSGDEEYLEKQMSPMSSTEPFQTNLSSNASDIGEKCRRGQTTKQQNSGVSSGERNMEAKEKREGLLLGSNARTNQKGIHRLQRSESNASSVARSSRSAVSRGVKLPYSESNNLDHQAVKKSHAISSSLAEEVADAIERIETQISALQLCSRRVEPNNDNALRRWMYKSPSSITQSKENSFGTRCSLYEDYNVTPTQITSQKEGTDCGKSIQTSASSLKSSYVPVSQQLPQTSSNLHAWPSSRTTYGIAAENVKKSRVPTYDNPALPPRFHQSLSRHDQSVLVDSPMTRVKSRPPLPPRPVRSVDFRKPSQSNRTSHRTSMRPTLLDQESEPWDEDPRERESCVSPSVTSSEDELVSVEQDSEETRSGYTGLSSGSWTSRSEYVSESNSKSYSSLPSAERETSEYLESSEESISSYSPQDDSEEIASSHRTTYRSSDHAKPRKKAIGRFKRFKNKLGLIFHHHHHHHHLHHHQKPSAWKQLQKTFQQKHKRGADDRLRKTEARGLTTHKHQIGHFHGLVEGLMRHVRHSKKPRPSTKLRSRGCKSHWWQMLKRQGGVKMPKRGRVKLGYASKRHAHARPVSTR